MSAFKPLIAASALALAAAPILANAHGGVRFGIFIGSPGWSARHYGYPGYYRRYYHRYYHHRYYYPRYYYHRHYIHRFY
jgi:hypothetical protein